MKKRFLQPILPALALPLLSVSALAQTTGVSHPDSSDEVTTSTAQADHYVMPSHAAAVPQTPAAPAYQDSYPATASPRLLPREEAMPAPAPAVSSAPAPIEYRPYTAPAPVRSAEVAEGNDDGIVLSVPTRPHELNAGVLLHARLREGLNTETTPEGSVFTAELTQNAGHSGEIMLPAGSLIRGHVTSVHGGKRITGGAAIHLRPESISLPDGTLYRLDAQITDLDSTQDLRVNDEGTVVIRSNPKAAAAVVGGVTATAAVTGAVIGGGVGAAVGAVAGAGVATVVYLKREVQEVLPADTNVIFALNQPLVVTPR